MTDKLRLQVHITARDDWDEEPYTLEWNIAEHLLELVLGFGNGVWAEIRIVTETQEGLDAMRDLLSNGGSRPGATPKPRTTLLQPGDECWAGFVFLAVSGKSMNECLSAATQGAST